MSKNKSTYVRFNGYISDNLEFRYIPGWEVERISKFRNELKYTDEEKSFIVETLTSEGIVINQSHPKIEKRISCTNSGKFIQEHPMWSYIALNPEAKYLQFRKGNFLLFKKKIQDKKPKVKITNVEVRKSKVYLSWESDNKNEVWFNVAVVINKKRLFKLAANYQDVKGSFDISRFQLGRDTRFIVIITDGILSSFNVSKKFTFKEEALKACYILTPQDNEVFACGQAISFCGNEFDSLGKKQIKDNLSWELNGKIIKKGECSGTIYGLEPGKYSLELKNIKGNNKEYKKAIVKFSVSNRSKESLRYNNLLKDFNKEP